MFKNLIGKELKAIRILLKRKVGFVSVKSCVSVFLKAENMSSVSTLLMSLKLNGVTGARMINAPYGTIRFNAHNKQTLLY